MFPPTLTPHAVSTEAFQHTGSIWRLVEAQHFASTMKLVDDPDEHELLEQLLDDSKPPMPDAVRNLHYLLATPFRYPTRMGGTRFRAAIDPGVFYGAISIRTACAELGYWRWKFLDDAEDLTRIEPVSHTAFETEISAPAIDLRKNPFSQYEALWMDRTDYRGTQNMARLVRDAELQAILYQSVRDKNDGVCVALLDPAGFAAKEPKSTTQTWNLAVTREKVYWRRDQYQSFVFDPQELTG